VGTVCVDIGKEVITEEGGKEVITEEGGGLPVGEIEQRAC
jgi:hypothetical protein